VFGLKCKFGGVDLCWFELFVDKNVVVWINEKMI